MKNLYVSLLVIQTNGTLSEGAKQIQQYERKITIMIGMTSTYTYVGRYVDVPTSVDIISW